MVRAVGKGDGLMSGEFAPREEGIFETCLGRGYLRKCPASGVIVTYEQHVAWCIRHSDDYQKGDKSTDAEERGLVVSLCPRTNVVRRRFSCTQSQEAFYAWI